MDKRSPITDTVNGQNELLDVVKAAYLKHHCWQDSVSWKRLSEMMQNALCSAKLALAMTWRWLYLLQTNLTGEIHEYMRGQGARTPAGDRSQWRWITDVQAYVRAWAWEHRDGRKDVWTGTKRDLAIQ